MFMNLVTNKKILNLLNKIFKERFILSNFNASRPINNFKKYRLHIDSRMPILIIIILLTLLQICVLMILQVKMVQQSF